MTTSSIVFCCSAQSARELDHALTLRESINSFAGRMREAPFWLVAAQSVLAVTGRRANRLRQAQLDVLPLDLTDLPAGLPFSVKTYGAALAERRAFEQGIPFLVWMDAGSLVLRQPDGLLLPHAYSFGYRPVDHTLIGSRYATAPDRFWELIYELCGSLPGSLFAMPTTVDGQVLRPYFNAGLMVVRPDLNLLSTWATRFAVLQQGGAFAEFLHEDLYQVFFHQAVLAGTILSRLGPEEMLRLPPEISYPLHMHNQHRPENMAPTLDNLTTVRHEGVFDRPGWRDELHIDVSPELTAWIDTRFGARA